LITLIIAMRCYYAIDIDIFIIDSLAIIAIITPPILMTPLRH
jgi:hypothetical protein